MGRVQVPHGACSVCPSLLPIIINSLQSFPLPCLAPAATATSLLAIKLSLLPLLPSPCLSNHPLLPSPLPSAKLESIQSPPPLSPSPSASDKGREQSTTLDNTPIATPVACESPWYNGFHHRHHPNKLPEKNSSLFSRWKRPAIAVAVAVDDPQPSPRASHLHFSDDWHFEDSGEDLFEPRRATTPLTRDDNTDLDDLDLRVDDVKVPPTMNATSAPIDIRGSRWSSATSSPRLHASNLTSALRDAGAVDDSFPLPDAADVAAALAAADGRQQLQQRQQQSQQAGSAASRAGDYPLGTASGMSWRSSGPRPISVKERPRRESNTGSVNGMSWSAMSVGSWIKDEYVCPCHLQFLVKHMHWPSTTGSTG